MDETQVLLLVKKYIKSPIKSCLQLCSLSILFTECLFIKKIYSSLSGRKDISILFELFRYMSNLRLHACWWT